MEILVSSLALIIATHQPRILYIFHTPIVRLSDCDLKTIFDFVFVKNPSRHNTNFIRHFHNLQGVARQDNDGRQDNDEVFQILKNIRV